jgi:hypothetical protein
VIGFAYLQSWHNVVPKKQFLREKQKRVDKLAYIFNLNAVQLQKRLFSGDVWARLISTGFRGLISLKSDF